MGNMIERVAKDIYVQMPSALPYGESKHKPKWVESGNSDKQKEARLYARVAILSLREPTEEMVNAAYGSTDKWAWQAMIDAALEAKRDKANG